MALQMTRKKQAARAPEPAADMDQGEVARVAYALFLERGATHGHDQEDWLRAEQLVRQQRRRNGR